MNIIIDIFETLTIELPKFFTDLRRVEESTVNVIPIKKNGDAKAHNRGDDDDETDREDITGRTGEGVTA